MSKNLLALGVIIVLVLAGGYFAYTKYSGTNPSTPQTPSPTQTPTQTTSEGSPSADMMQQSVVKITATGFQPSTITIKAGESVTWINQETKIRNVSSDPHPQHTLHPFMNIGNIAASKESSVTFSSKGTYTYHDHLTPSHKGTIVVE